jgi:hypothetical protein
MYEVTASCKDIARVTLTNWDPRGVTLVGYCYAVRHGTKILLVNPYRVSHLQSYGVVVRGNVTRVYPPLSVGMHSAMDSKNETVSVNCTPLHQQRQVLL